MIEEIRDLVDKYSVWVRDKSVLRDLGDSLVEVTTPYLDRHNDYVQLYVRRENGSYLLTDGGETIADLRSSGCDLDTPKRKALLSATLNGFGIQLDHEALSVKASATTFPLRKHNLIQAMLAVNDMFVLSVPVVASLFHEDVAGWLDLHDIRYTPSVQFKGKSGYDHTFDFVVPASRRAPERLLRAITRPTREMAETLAFAWIDTREVRPAASHFYAILNDQERAPAASITDALKSYDIRPVLWSAREEARTELLA